MNEEETNLQIFKALKRAGKDGTEEQVIAVQKALAANYSNASASDDILETRIEVEASK